MTLAPALPRTWHPLLEGADRDAALAAARDVAEALPGPAELEASPGRGNAGLAVFFTYLAAAEPGRGHEDRAEAHLDAALAEASPWLGPGLYAGLTGLGWTLEHLHGRLLAEDGEDPNADTDAILAELLSQGAGRGHFDLVSGLAGVGLYALSRAHRASGRALLAQVVGLLAGQASEQGDGIAWFTRPGLLAPWERELYPEGYWNLGLAHGMPGPIAVLAGACARGVAVETARPLLDRAAAWLLARENPPGSANACFGTVIPGVPTGREDDPGVRDSRIAWCYGDLGLSLALLNAARAVGEPAWEAAALRAARRAAARPVAEGRAVDPGLCHGAAGNAHLFNRLWQATGEPAFAEAARAWLRETFRFRRPGHGHGGFQAWYRIQGAGNEWTDSPGLLEGAAGVALALLAAATPQAPDWDQFLLASLPAAKA